MDTDDEATPQYMQVSRETTAESACSLSFDMKDEASWSDVPVSTEVLSWSDAASLVTVSPCETVTSGGGGTDESGGGEEGGGSASAG